MKLVHFASDNTSGVHPKFMDAIVAVNEGHVQSYGLDPITERFNENIKKTFGHEAEAYLVFNGTAANVLGLATGLKPHQGVICADHSHLAVDECGAPEKWLGAKLFLTPSINGKISLNDVKKHLVRLGDQHYSQPRILSIAQPTEMGTAYSINELREISEFCKTHRLLFHMDGARLANAAVFLNCELSDITSKAGVDILSFGGTKNGMMGAEAIVFFSSDLARDFKFIRKQGMQLASKQRFLSAQFNAYLENDLWREIASHTHGLTKYFEQEIKGIPWVEIVAPVQSNGLFVKIPKSWIGPLKQKHFFYVWDEFTNVCRWMITWDHTEQDVQSFVKKLRELAHDHS